MLFHEKMSTERRCLCFSHHRLEIRFGKPQKSRLCEIFQGHFRQSYFVPVKNGQSRKKTDLKSGFPMPKSLLHFPMEAPWQNAVLPQSGRGAQSVRGTLVLRRPERRRAPRGGLEAEPPRSFPSKQQPIPPQFKKLPCIFRRHDVNVTTRFFTLR